jgi:hypothetical protein
MSKKVLKGGPNTIKILILARFENLQNSNNFYIWQKEKNSFQLILKMK